MSLTLQDSGRRSERHCPDWADLVAARDASAEDLPAWSEALRHLDGCHACREEALEADPTLMFRRLPGPQITVDVEAMKSAVATLRRTGPLQTAPVVSRRTVWRRRLSGVAAALLFAMLLGVTPNGTSVPEADEEFATAMAESWIPGASLFEAAGFSDSRLTSTPTASSIEELDLPDSRAYELTTEGLTVAVLVSGDLDV